MRPRDTDHRQGTDRETLAGLVERVTFHNAENGFCVLGDDFYWDAGYNAWAEANRIVVLYPQATAWDRRRFDVTGLTGNPSGCWDWWVYSGFDYFRQSGKQMRAVRQMIDRLLPG